MSELENVRDLVCSVTDMVRLGLIDSFVGALALDAAGDAEVRLRLSSVSTTLHTEL